MAKTINYSFSKDGLTINVTAKSGRIFESIRSQERELSYVHFRSSCAGNLDLIECYAQGRLAEFARSQGGSQ